jgi:hypothetical protein
LEKSLIFRSAIGGPEDSEFSINAAKLVFVETKFPDESREVAAVAIARRLINRAGESYHYKVYKDNE